MEALDGVSAEVAAIFRGKEQRRKDLAALPYAEKVRAVIRLQHMAAAILRTRGRTARPWSAGDRPVCRNRKPALKVNINTATEQELETLPNIGPARAKLIIAGRPYKSVEELKKVSGIGDKQLEAIRPFAKTDGKTECLASK